MVKLYRLTARAISTITILSFSWICLGARVRTKTVTISRPVCCAVRQYPHDWIVGRGDRLAPDMMPCPTTQPFCTNTEYHGTGQTFIQFYSVHSWSGIMVSKKPFEIMTAFVLSLLFRASSATDLPSIARKTVNYIQNLSYGVFDLIPDSPSVAGRQRNARHGNNHYIQDFCV
jgi:hypothetical protein